MEQIRNLIPSEMLAQSFKPMTPEERSKQRCDIWNAEKGNLNESDGYDCPLCNNRGGHYEPRFENGCWYEVMVLCKCDTIRRALRRLNKSGLKDMVNKYTFKSFEDAEPWQRKLKESAVDYCQNGQGNWFFIGGQSGAGKTHICSAVAVHLLKKGHSTKYMLWREDVVKLKSVVNEGAEYEALITEMKEADVLYIDDLFKTGKDKDGNNQKPTAADINIAFEIINHRYNNPNLYTIISSECTISQILSIDEAVGGRIAEKAVQTGYGFSINPDTKKNHRLKGICEL